MIKEINMSEDKNQTALQNSCVAMSTKEISDLTGKQTGHVNRDTEKMLKELGEDVSKFGGIYKDSYGRDQDCYILSKDLTLTLVSGYNVKMRKAIIDRWIQLEEAGNELTKAIQNADPIVLRKLADISEKNQKLKQDKEILKNNLNTAKEKIDSLEPMAEYGYGIYSSENLYTVTNIGQELCISGRQVNYHLKRLHVIRKGTGRYTDWELCSRFLNYGLIDYKETPGFSNTLNEQITHRALRWTRKGFDWLVQNGDLLKDMSRKSLPLPKQELVKRGA
jgi:phage regulator Rha-like protein